jgi:elongation factor Ts
MAEITAAAVMALREKTGLPMMECKKALAECGGDTDQAVEWLRKQGVKTQSLRADRETSCGRLAVYADAAKGVGTIVEFKCESPPVAGSPDFKDLVNDIAKTLALGPGAKTPDELLAQKSQAHPGKTLGELKDDLFNRMREVFELSRIKRIDAPCGGYAHHDGSKAALVEIGGNTSAATAAEVAKDIAMHVVALAPQAIRKEDLDPAVVEKEREILSAAARKEGKPENIISKMIEGRLRNFFSQCVLLEQPFVKDDKQTVGQLAKAAGLEVRSVENWKLGG